MSSDKTLPRVMWVWNRRDGVKQRRIVLAECDGGAIAACGANLWIELLGNSGQWLCWDHCEDIDDAPNMRLMTRAGALGWAYNDGANGHQVKTRDLPDGAVNPSLYGYVYEMYKYLRRTIGSDGQTGPWLPFEVPVDEN